MAPSPIQPAEDRLLILLPTSTPTPLAERDIPTRTIQLEERLDITTVSVTNTPTAAAASQNQSAGFPVAVAVPALVGGMALALAGAGFWWFWSKKKERERRERWERQQRRKERKRANSAATRPSISGAAGGRQPSNGTTGSKSPVDEKQFIPPVPALPKAHDPYSYPQQQQYGQQQQYSQEQQYQQAYNYASSGGAFNAYAVQPSVDHVENPRSQAYDQHSTTPSSDAYDNANEHAQQYQPPTYDEETSQPVPKEKESGSKEKSSSKSSRSAARIAAAESAAARADSDPNTRWRPNKPSPLALKAAQDKAAALASPSKGRGYDAYGGDDRQEMLAVPNSQRPLSAESGYGQDDSRVTSGEWGVALGSPVHDGGFNAQQGQRQERYSNDPYLSASASNDMVSRAQSGQYSYDPYAAYHDTSNKQPSPARRGQGAGWV